MLLSKQIQGFLLFKSGEGLSARTLENYERRLQQFADHVGDQDVADITSIDIASFMDYMKNEYEPNRLNGDEGGLSSSSLRNIWVSLRSFYTWSEETFDTPDVMRKVKAPKVQTKEVVPFEEEEIRQLLKETRPRRAKRPKSDETYFLALRNRALICLLLDTGLRASELSRLTIGDVHLASGRISIIGKGGKHRYVYAATTTSKYLWQYLSERADGDDPSAPLIATNSGRHLNRRSLYRVVSRLGKRAGVEDVHPHRFRHTFAIQYLRNGGDIFTLQMLLGHSSLKMVRHYARLAEVDTARAHATASPVDNWFR